VFNDWVVVHEQAAEELRWRAAAIDRYLKLKPGGSQASFLDAFAAFRDWERQNPDEAANFIQESPEEAVAAFARNPGTANLVRDLAFAYVRPEQFPAHSALIEQLLFNTRGGVREREESDRVGKLLRAWSLEGEKGRLFDGISNIRIDGRVAHFELGQIPEHATEMRAAANFLVANYGRQKIITMPRSIAKIAIFEEAARTLEIPGGVRMIQEYYRQMRKFGCNILAVVQQYDVLQGSEVRGAMIGNQFIARLCIRVTVSRSEGQEHTRQKRHRQKRTTTGRKSAPLADLGWDRFGTGRSGDIKQCFSDEANTDRMRLN
jgi:type IV secretion system protein TrbE